MKLSQTVLITGASTGIGFEMAQVFAQKGHDLVLVARSQDKLQTLASEVTQKYGTQVLVIPADLNEPQEVERIFSTLEEKGISISILVNNAGLGYVGYVHDISPAQNDEMVRVNVLALTHLSAAAAKHMMAANNRPKLEAHEQNPAIKMRQDQYIILNVASTGSFAPGPFTAVYYATKAYVLSFSEALRYELKDFGIEVKTLCPGATLTEFSRHAGKREAAMAMSSRAVALAAYKGLSKSQAIIVPGFMNKILIRLPKKLVSPLNFKNQRALSNR